MFNFKKLLTVLLIASAPVLAAPGLKSPLPFGLQLNFDYELQLDLTKAGKRKVVVIPKGIDATQAVAKIESSLTSKGFTRKGDHTTSAIIARSYTGPSKASIQAVLTPPGSIQLVLDPVP